MPASVNAVRPRISSSFMNTRRPCISVRCLFGGFANFGFVGLFARTAFVLGLPPQTLTRGSSPLDSRQGANAAHCNRRILPHFVRLDCFVFGRLFIMYQSRTRFNVIFESIKTPCLFVRNGGSKPPPYKSFSTLNLCNLTALLIYSSLYSNSSSP